MDKINVGVVGALGAVGNEMIKTLEKSGLNIDELRPLDTFDNAGKVISFKGKQVGVKIAELNAFKGLDLALFSAGATASRMLAPIAIEEGAVVVDNSSAWRMVDHVPLVVPEVNPEALKEHKGLIANPNCSTIQMLVALKPLHSAYGIKRIVVSTYQAVSGSGIAAINELSSQTKNILENKKVDVSVYPHQIAFNALPQIDVFLENGYTKEEMKMINETHKILDPEIKVCPTAVRVPVFRSHSESINVELISDFSIGEVIKLLEESEGITVVDDIDNLKYPLAIEAEGKNNVYVGRIRRDSTIQNGLNLWVVADNLRKGAALNAVQIAEKLVEMNLHKKKKVKELV